MTYYVRVLQGINVSLNVANDSLSVDYANKNIYLTVDKFLKDCKIVMKCLQSQYHINVM